ncbi:retropepsin-like aspartic protease [Chryseobacterium sp. Chry.R1]|uniref:retropepsin-like aspartic protease n=1 Tax=Chryseobacterium sp. Chry.R1 TaxID=3139392 RepID=UPI0031F7B8E7
MMNTKFKKLTFFLTTLLGLINIYAQQIKLPFELSKDNKSIFIKLPMENQKDSLRFFFDTGANTTMLDKKIAEKYNLKTNYKTEVKGAGGKKLYDLVINQKIFLDRNNSIDSTYIVLDDLSRFNTLYEKKFDGIIGAAILKNYVTKIDFETKTMNLYKFDDSVDYNGYEKIPFEFYSGIPRFPITFELRNNEKFSGDILFDSGAGLNLLVNAPYTEKNDLIHKIGKTITKSSINLSNKTNYNKGLIESIQLGSTIIKDENLGIHFSSDKQGVSSLDNLLGILGSEIINRFNFILDYKNKNLYLKPNYLFHKNFK